MGNVVTLEEIAKETGRAFESVVRIALNSGLSLSKNSEGRYCVDEENKDALVERIIKCTPNGVAPRPKRTKETTEEKAAVKKTSGVKVKGSKISQVLFKEVFGPSVDAKMARSFLLGSKSKLTSQLALMTDEEVLKEAEKYAFLTVSNGNASVKLAVPFEVLRSIDLSQVVIMDNFVVV